MKANEDRNTYLLGAILPALIAQNPQAPKTIATEANQILDALVAYDVQRFSRPLSAEPDEIVEDLPHPGDMVPPSDPVWMREWRAGHNERMFTGFVKGRVDRIYDALNSLAVDLTLEPGSDAFEAVMQIKSEVREVQHAYAFRELHRAKWDTEFWDLTALHQYIAENVNEPV